MMLTFTGSGWGWRQRQAKKSHEMPFPLAMSAAVAVLCGALGARLGYAAIGTIPAPVMVTAYFTTLY